MFFVYIIKKTKGFLMNNKNNNADNAKFLKILTRALYNIDGFDQKIDIKPESDLKKDLNLDDVDITQIIMILESKYGVNISDDYRINIHTVKDLNKVFNIALLGDLVKGIKRQVRFVHILNRTR